MKLVLKDWQAFRKSLNLFVLSVLLFLRCDFQDCYFASNLINQCGLSKLTSHKILILENKLAIIGDNQVMGACIPL